MKKELFNASIASGQNALRAGMFINGAASISMLTFIGSIANGEQGKEAAFIKACTIRHEKEKLRLEG